MNKEQREKSYLLTPKGLLQQSGRAREMAFEYDRMAVPPIRRLLRLKEHDRYIFGNEKVQIELSLADYGYAGVVCASVVCPEAGTEKTTVLTTPLSLGCLELQSSPDWGDVIFRAGSSASVDFSKSTGKRYIRCRVERFDDVRSLYINVTLEEPDSEQFCSAEGRTGEPECFRLCHRIMNMQASGTVVYGADTYTLSASDSLGCLDWERSVLGAKGEYSWFAAQGESDGVPFSFSFSGQKDPLRPDVNAVTLGGKIYNPGDIRVYEGRDRHEGELTLRSTNGRLELKFEPMVSRECMPRLLNVPFSHSELRYGRWSGRIKVGSSKSIDLRSVLGYAEMTGFRW